MVLAGLTSCTSFDDPTTENYGAAPGIDVQIIAGTPSDSAFTIKITPAAGAAYYAFAIDQSDVAEQLDSATLYKGGYGNTVLKVADQPSLTIPITTAAPNTTYQVYAVAGSDKGIVGSIVVKSIKTTDGKRPVPGRFAQGPEQKAIQIAFSEAIARGDGAVTGKYYKEWDWENPVDVAADEIDVQIQGNVIQLTAPNTPDGAYVLFSWAEGAFVDSKGNKCAAFNTTYNEEKDDFDGYWVQNKQVAFEIADSYVTPVSGTPIGDWQEFRGTVTFPNAIFRNDVTVEKGDVQVSYINGNRNVTYNLTAEQWAVEGNKLTFALPVEPAIGDMIVFTIAEGAVADVYGNPNTEYVSEGIALQYVGFVATKEMLIGSFNIIYISYWSEDGSAASMGSITIEENTEKENTLIIKNLFLEGSAMEATYDLEKGKLIIPDGQLLGQLKDEDGTYDTYFYTADGTDAATFTINKDGSLTADGMWGLYIYNVADESDKGWIEVAKVSQLVPANATSRKAAARAKSAKSFKLHKAARNLKKHVSK